MALSLAPSTLGPESSYISANDPAIDAESPDLDHGQWLATGDSKYLPMRPNEAPTIFTLRKLVGHPWDTVLGELVKKNANQQRALALAARYGIVKAANLDIRLQSEEDADGYPRLARDSFDRLYQFGNLVYELGARVIATSQPLESDPKA